MVYIYIYIYTMESYSAIEKNEVMPFVATWRDLEIISEVGQIPYDIPFMWNLKYDTNELMYGRETDSETQRADWWWPRRRGSGGGKAWESGISRCKLVYIGWIHNKVLLCSTGNYIQCP